MLLLNIQFCKEFLIKRKFLFQIGCKTKENRLILRHIVNSKILRMTVRVYIIVKSELS